MRKKLLTFGLFALVGCTSQSATRPVAHAQNMHCGQVLADASSDAALPILGASPIVVREGKQMLPRTRGARVIVHAQPAMTEQWLDRVVACRMSQYQGMRARGANSSELASDPLAVEGIRARVVPLRGSFAIDITAAQLSDAREVLARAQRVGS